MTDQKLSFVIPVHNECESVKILLGEIKNVMQNINTNYEVIFVNDGSTDKTQERLNQLHLDNPNILKVIEFRKNFGKSDAYKAGFNLCTGDLIFTMDGDLQDDPIDIKKFLNKIEEGFDIVIGWKHQRQDSNSKIVQSRLFNYIVRKMIKIQLHDFDNGYRCMKKEIIQYLDLYEGLYRYIPVFASSKGFRLSEVQVNHRKRKFGKSKFGYSRLSKGFFDLITLGFISVYIKRPLHFFGGIGSLFFLLGFGLASYLTYIKFVFSQSIGSRPLLTLSVLFIIIGIQLILFGLLGEMIANTSKKENGFTIKKILK
ncbi:MAG: glycosyltransferase family 2 protein [bacterium]|nr:glycosyltransferase family 2 protein [bacterium]